MSSKGGSSGGM
ncbi:retroviral pseudoprotease-like protein, partial [Monkeypox virus]